MRNEVLRDVLAGCAGVLAVAAVIGLPNGAAGTHVRAEFSGVQHAVLLPHYSRIGGPADRPIPQPRITTTTRP
jgi:hypothetical protein